MQLIERAVATLVVSAVALLAAALLLDRFTIDTLSFPIVVVVFTVVWLIARPLARGLLADRAREVSWGIGLVATWATLLVTDLLSDGIQIEGLVTWALATVIVWAALLVADLVADALLRGTRN
jgi:hypothetical protein